MHDLDHTLTELEAETDSFDSDEMEYEDEFEQEDEYEYEDEASYDDTEMEGSIDEADEMELATDLLNVSSDAELDMFLGKLFKKASRSLRKVVRGPLGGILKKLAKKALPLAGGALGTFFGGPAGTLIGSKLGSFAGRAFGLELEGLSPEDQEFEVARRFVRLACAATRKAAQNQTTAPPVTVAKKAVAEAARRYAPGLARRGRAARPRSAGAYARSGRWLRRGRRIMLTGV